MFIRRMFCVTVALASFAIFFLNFLSTAPCNVDMFSGPFDDTQFDAVVDVETCDDGIDAGT